MEEVVLRPALCMRICQDRRGACSHRPASPRGAVRASWVVGGQVWPQRQAQQTGPRKSFSCPALRHIQPCFRQRPRCAAGRGRRQRGAGGGRLAGCAGGRAPGGSICAVRRPAQPAVRGIFPQRGAVHQGGCCASCRREEGRGVGKERGSSPSVGGCCLDGCMKNSLGGLNATRQTCSQPCA